MFVYSRRWEKLTANYATRDSAKHLEKGHRGTTRRPEMRPKRHQIQRAAEIIGEEASKSSVMNENRTLVVQLQRGWRLAPASLGPVGH